MFYVNSSKGLLDQHRLIYPLLVAYNTKQFQGQRTLQSAGELPPTRNVHHLAKTFQLITPKTEI